MPPSPEQRTQRAKIAAHTRWQRLAKPRATVDRQLQALHMLGVLVCEEEDAQQRTVWRYRPGDGLDLTVLDPGPVPDLSPHGDTEMGRETDPVCPPTDISGTDPAGCAKCGDPLPATADPGDICVTCWRDGAA